MTHHMTHVTIQKTPPTNETSEHDCFDENNTYQNVQNANKELRRKYT